MKGDNFAFCDPDGSMSSALHQSISNCIETVEKRFREIEKDFEDEMTNEFRTVAKASGESLQDLVDSIPQFGV